MFLLIAILGIPYKVLKPFLKFIKSEKSTWSTLREMYETKKYEMTGKKIEIIDGEITLNCYTVGKLLHALANNRKTSAQQTYTAFLELQKIIEEYSLIESKKNDMVEMKLTAGYDKNNKQIFPPHFAHIYYNASMHATSAIPNDMAINQKIERPMRSLIKKSSKNPATVVTEGVHSTISLQKSKYVPKIEIDWIKYNNLSKFPIKDSVIDYHFKKEQEISIYLMASTTLSVQECKNLGKDIRMNLYNTAVLNVNSYQIEKELEEIYTDI